MKRSGLQALGLDSLQFSTWCLRGAYRGELADKVVVTRSAHLLEVT